MGENRTLEIPAELYERIERLAAVRETSIAYVVQDALTLAVDQMEIGPDEAKMDAEDAAYQAMHPELMERFAGQFVAIHNGKVVDVDKDEMAIYFRIDERFPDEVILIKRVVELPEPELYVPSFRLLPEAYND
jgi:predicted transcriptional regulator